MPKSRRSSYLIVTGLLLFALQIIWFDCFSVKTASANEGARLSAPKTISPHQLSQQAKVRGSDTGDTDTFGLASSQTSDGNISIICDKNKFYNSQPFAGACYVFARSNGNWSQQAEITPDDTGQLLNFGYAVSLTPDGSTALIGADNTAYIFSHSGNNWTQTAKLTPTDNSFGDAFGWSVSISADGNTALIGAEVKAITDPYSFGEGAAYTFTRSGNTWTQQTEMTLSDAAVSDNFGSAVSLSSDGKTALIAAFRKPVNSVSEAGAVYVYTGSGSTWNQIQMLSASDAKASAQFGYSISLSGDGKTGLIGAIGNNSAYIFSGASGSWSQQQELQADDANLGAWFGNSVTLSKDGSTALISDPLSTVGSNLGQGAGYIFTHGTTGWVQKQKLVASDGFKSDYLGDGVSLNGDGSTAILGESQHGYAYIFAGTSGGTGTSNYTYYLPFLANNFNQFTTYLAIQNSGSAAATVQISYFDTGGHTLNVSSSTCGTLAVNAECVSSNPFSSGTSGTSAITSSQPLNIIVAESTPYGGSAYAVNAGASNSLIVPIALNKAYGSFSTQLRVFNAGSSTSNVTINFYNADGSPAPASSTKTVPLGSHISEMYDQSSNSGLPAGFNGWAQINSPSGSQLVAQVLEQNPSTHFVAIANTQTSAQTTLYAPAIFNGAFGAFVTGANIVNPGDAAVTVNVTYYKNDGSSIAAAPINIAAHAVAAVYNGGANSGLPAGFYGSAKVTSTGNGVVMVVNEAGGVTATGTALSGTYAAASTGSNSVGLPVMAKGGYGYTTGATILNTGDQAVNVSIQYYNIDGTLQGGAQSFNIPAHASQLAYQGGPGLPDQFYGTAIIKEVDSTANNLIVTTNAQSSAFFYTYTEPNN